MKTHLLFKGVFVFALSFFALRFDAGAQVNAELNEGGMQRVFQDLSIMPNPFHDKLIISYTLPVESDVAVEMYNALGQKIRQYSESAVRQQAGTHQVILFRPASADPGIYFVRLTVPDVGSLTTRVMAK